MSGEVVPFGKHKGQAVEVLLADPRYARWLAAQPWFSARYPELHAAIINAGDVTVSDGGILGALAAKREQQRAVLVALGQLEPEPPEEGEEGEGEGRPALPPPPDWLMALHAPHEPEQPPVG